jgi:hypothetical protein
VSDDKEGRKVRCKECGEDFIVEQEEEDERPRKSRQGGSSALVATIAALVIVAGGGGIGLAVILSRSNESEQQKDTGPGMALADGQRPQPPGFPPPNERKEPPPTRPQPSDPMKDRPDFPKLPADFPKLPADFPKLPPDFPKLPPKFPKPQDKPPTHPKEPAKPAHEAEEAKWEVNPDPGPEFAKGPCNLKTLIDFKGPLVYSTAPSSPYVALAPAKATNVMVVVDLRTMKQYGAPIAGNFNAFNFTNLTLSPDGDYFAARINHDLGAKVPTKIAVWSVATGKQIHLLELDPNHIMKLGLIDFRGKDQLFTMKHEHEFPDPSTKSTYQTWDLKTGRVMSEFSTNHVYAARWAGLSPGRRYMIQEETGTVSGYHLLVWDLDTGKNVGDIEFQGKKDKWGSAAGFAFSPDGEQVAMLWWQSEKPKRWGRLLCFDVKTGKKVHDYPIGYAFPHLDSVAGVGGTRSIQWIPDNSGWLLFCHVLIDRKTGTVLGKLAPEPNGIKIDDRRFLNRDHISTGSSLGFNPRIGVNSIQWDLLKPAAP